jgi:tRNA threonylcarbamoyladenosine biosynthesis protein TsaB
VSDETWLAIDTATEIASVAVRVREQTFTRSIRGARQHAAQILPLIDDVLKAAQLPLDQVGGIIVADGPGSFTGLRIGWAAAKGLLHGRRHASLIAIPSLLGAAHAAGVRTVAACYDALRGQVYGAVYEFTDDAVKTLVPADVFTIAQLVAAAPRRPELAVGDGAARYRAEVQQWTGRPPVDLDALPPTAGSLLALYEYEGARSPRADASVVEPVYGRPAEAQVKWETRHGRPLPHSSR